MPLLNSRSYSIDVHPPRQNSELKQTMQIVKTADLIGNRKGCKLSKSLSSHGVIELRTNHPTSAFRPNLQSIPKICKFASTFTNTFSCTPESHYLHSSHFSFSETGRRDFSLRKIGPTENKVLTNASYNCGTDASRILLERKTLLMPQPKTVPKYEFCLIWFWTSQDYFNQDHWAHIQVDFKHTTVSATASWQFLCS